MKRKYILVYAFIASLVLGIIGFTYAWFSMKIIGNENAKNIIVKANGLNLVYTDTTPLILNQIIPGDTITKVFKVKNESNNTMNYQMKWKDLINTFKAGELRISLTCISKDENDNVSGTCENVDSKMIPYTETQRSDYVIKNNIEINSKITHEYTMTIEFIEKTINQSYNKNKTFNGKIIIENATAVNNCTFDGNLTQGAEYINGQYTYRYMQEYFYNYEEGFYWSDIDADGWGVALTDSSSTSAVTTQLCTSINNKPIVSMSAMFVLSQATTLDLSSFDTSNVTNMYGMFALSQATTLDLSSFDTSNVTDMSYMFYQSQSIELDLSSFDTSNVTSMSYMFSYSQATELDLSSFDTSNVTDMSDMFAGSQATTLDLSSFDTSNVINMESMFEESSASILNLSNFNTINVTNMDAMFYMSHAAEIIGLNNFNTSKVTNMDEMFASSNAMELDLSSFDTSGLTEINYMFEGSQATTIDLSSFDTSNVTSMSGMFWDCHARTIYVGSKWDTSSVDRSNNMFTDATNLRGGAGTTYNSSNPKDKTYAHVDGGVSNPGYFTDKDQIEEETSVPTRPVNNCTYNGSLTQGTEYTNGQYTYRYMQEGTSPSWQNINADGWGVKLTDKNSTDAVTTPLCTSINGKPIVSMSYMFYQSQATTLDLSSFDTSNVTTMSGMFYQSQATTLDLSSFDTSIVTSMQSMFEYSPATTIYVSDKWNTSNVAGSSNMFYHVTNLVGGEGTTYSSSNPRDKTYAHIDGGVSNPGYFTDKDQIEEETSVPTRPVNNCTYNGSLTQGAEYVNGQYTYRYKQENVDDSWSIMNVDGWGVMLTDKNSTAPVTTPLCTSINGKPIVSMSDMFYYSQTTSIDLSSFDTTNVVNMEAMFAECNVNSLDLGNFDTSNVTDMSAMFDSINVTSLNLSSFDTSNVTNMVSMFYGCYANTLDLSSFDTSNVTDMRQMFYASRITTIYVSDKWNTSSVTSSNNMFYNSTSLIGGAGTVWKSTNPTDKTYARIDNPTSGKPGYFTYKSN